MAGVTNPAYRQLCREQAERGSGGRRPAGVFTCEMIAARGVADRIGKTLAMMAPDPADPLPSVQLYGTDAATVGRAVTVACGDFGIRHVDLNFGCPVPKVTRRGGGGVLPWKVDRLAAIIAAAVGAAQPFGVPVTLKTRIGIDEAHTTMVDSARIAAEEGAAALTLHARTVEQAYSGQARWSAIADLVAVSTIPIMGNGDVWEAGDAVRLMALTGCAGVAVGRGALGRPWLFRDLAAAMVTGAADTPTLPTLGEVAAMIYRHAELNVEHFHDEGHGLADLRKHVPWYFKGFHVGGDLRARLGQVSSLAELDTLLAQLDPTEPFPREQLAAPRGRQGAPRARVTMPMGWLDSRYLRDATVADDIAPGG